MNGNDNIDNRYKRNDSDIMASVNYCYLTIVTLNCR